MKRDESNELTMEHLPIEILVAIFDKLTEIEKLRLRLVCRSWKVIIEDNSRVVDDVQEVCKLVKRGDALSLCRSFHDENCYKFMEAFITKPTRTIAMFYINHSHHKPIKKILPYIYDRAIPVLDSHYRKVLWRSIRNKLFKKYNPVLGYDVKIHDKLILGNLLSDDSIIYKEELIWSLELLRYLSKRLTTLRTSTWIPKGDHKLQLIIRDLYCLAHAKDGDYSSFRLNYHVCACGSPEFQEMALLAAIHGRDIRVIATVLGYRGGIESYDDVYVSLCKKLYYSTLEVMEKAVETLLFRCTKHSSDSLCKGFCKEWPKWVKRICKGDDEFLTNRLASLLSVSSRTEHNTLFLTIVTLIQEYLPRRISRPLTLENTIFQNLYILKTVITKLCMNEPKVSLIEKVIETGSTEVLMYTLGKALVNHSKRRYIPPTRYKLLRLQLLDTMIARGYLDLSLLHITQNRRRPRIIAPLIERSLWKLIMSAIRRNNPELVKLLLAVKPAKEIAMFDVLSKCISYRMVESLCRYPTDSTRIEKDIRAYVAIYFNWNRYCVRNIKPNLARMCLPDYYIPIPPTDETYYFPIANSDKELIVRYGDMITHKPRIIFDLETVMPLLVDDNSPLFTDIFQTLDFTGDLSMLILDAISYAAFDITQTLMLTKPHLQEIVMSHFGLSVLRCMALHRRRMRQPEVLIPYSRFALCVANIRDRYRFKVLSKWILRDEQLKEIYGTAVRTAFNLNWRKRT